MDFNYIVCIVSGRRNFKCGCTKANLHLHRPAKQFCCILIMILQYLSSNWVAAVLQSHYSTGHHKMHRNSSLPKSRIKFNKQGMLQKVAPAGQIQIHWYRQCTCTLYCHSDHSSFETCVYGWDIILEVQEITLLVKKWKWKQSILGNGTVVWNFMQLKLAFFHGFWKVNFHKNLPLDPLSKR